MGVFSKFKNATSKGSLPIEKAYVAKLYSASDFISESDGNESSPYEQAVSDFLQDNPGKSRSSFLDALYVQATNRLYRKSRVFKTLWDRVYGKMEVIERDYHIIFDKSLDPNDLGSMLLYYGIQMLESDLHKPLNKEKGRFFAATEQYYPTRSKKPFVTAYVFFFDG